MYAITATSYRAITSAADLQAGETAVDEVPQSLLDSLAASEVLRVSNAATLREQAITARADLKAFLALSSPTNAQTLAAVKLNCRVNLGLIRLVLGMLDGTD